MYYNIAKSNYGKTFGIITCPQKILYNSTLKNINMLFKSVSPHVNFILFDFQENFTITSQTTHDTTGKVEET